MKVMDEYKYTGNRTVYNKARKWYLESKGKINCGYCGYHKGENLKQHNNGKPSSWKKQRKNQYKTMEGSGNTR